MAQEPKRRHSKMRKRTRRAAIKLTPASLVACSNCKEMRLHHQACPSCGFFKAVKA